jgi:Spy/CpxP family protein refolding chaperone
MTRWKAILIFTGVFLAGVVTGGLAALRFAKAVVRERPPFEQMGAQQLKRLNDRLNLTEVQRERIRPILNEAGEELRRIRREQLKEGAQIMERAHQRIAAELDPRQREAFEEMRRALRERVRGGPHDKGGR